MNPLYTKLQELGGLWTTLSSAKLKNLFQISCCILQARSCNLQKCKDELSGITGEQLKAETAYARLKRVFQTGVIRPVLKALFVLILHMVHPEAGSFIILDRTEFKVGSRWVNLLVLGVEWHGVFVPLVWKDLSKRRISSQKERIQLLDRLLAWWKATRLDIPVLCIVGDREFTGKDWIMALENRNLQYVIRIKSNLKFPVWFNDQLKDRLIPLKVLARYMAKYGRRQMEIIINGTLVTNVMLMPQEKANAKEPFVLLLTNLSDWELCQAIFRKRWPIECCFKHMKSNGFDLEGLNLQGDHKINLLFGILTFVYVLVINEGILNKYSQVVPLKTYTNGKVYRQQSLFRFGLYQLKQKVKELVHLVEYLHRVVEEILNRFKYRKILYLNKLLFSS